MSAPLGFPAFKSCPCGSGRSFSACCEPFLRGEALAPTAEALMRSRFTAYALEFEPYVLASWHASTRPEALDLRGGGVRWQSLTVKRVEGGLPGNERGVVEFVARFVSGGERGAMREVSSFVWEVDRWWYVDGLVGS